MHGAEGERGVSIDLRLGRWQDVLGDVECDALVVDAPYSERTHGAYREMERVGRSAIGYGHWTAGDVDAFVAYWAPRTRGWVVSLTDHILAPVWERALESAGRYVFAPLACMEPGSRVRLCGDGPAQWSVFMVVARPANRAFQSWGALPGGYVIPAKEGWRAWAGGDNGARNGVMGAKPLWLMRAIVRDYSRPGDLVCDPCAGGATTLLAAAMEGRRAVGAEMDATTFAKAQARLAKGYTAPLFVDERQPAKQEPLALDADPEGAA